MEKHINPWHHVSAGENLPDEVNGIVEIPKGTRAKYELHKKTGLLMLDRVLYSSVYYPANYGFIPQSYGDDNDPLDILIFSQIQLEPLCIVPSKIIGVMRMLDNGEKDDKIIAVAKSDPSVNFINSISEFSDYTLTELRTFFEDYSKLENKTVDVKDFLGKETAIEILQKSLTTYQKKFNS